MHPRTLLIYAAAGALAVAPIVAARPAHADTVDTDYLATLAVFDVPVTSDAYAIALGHAVCTDLDAGASRTREIGAIANGDTTFTHADAAWLLGAATAAYCPAHNLGLHLEVA